MPDVTQQMLDDLADGMLALRDNVRQFRSRFFSDLTDDQRNGLRDLFFALGDDVDQITAAAIRQTVADVQDAISKLKDTTAGVEKAVKHLNDIRKMLTIATSLVGLGTAVAAGNFGGVLSALKDTAAAVA